MAKMQRRLRQAFTAIKERGSITYAKSKTATVGGLSDLDLIIVKATSPVDLPLSDRYVHELLKIFSISPSSLFRAFSLSFSRRFSKTQCWRVALKCLVLLHRLLRSLPENSPLRAELLWARSNGLLPLYPCLFRDSSSSSSEDYTVFIRSYARLLDEALDCFSIDSRITIKTDNHEDHEYEEEELLIVNGLLEQLRQLESVIDRIMECRPRGAAARSFLVQSAMKHIVRDSFKSYNTLRKVGIVVLDNLMEIPHQSCLEAFGMYKKASVQAKQLSYFYDWCKSTGLCGSYEYPFVDQIPQIQIQALHHFLSGMWKLPTDQSSPSSSTTTVEDESEIGAAGSEIDRYDSSGKKLERDDKEMGPLIRFDEVVDNNNVSWEALLEASISSSNKVLFNNSNGCGYEN